MNTDVFISYHTESSRSIVEAIVNKLESGGIRCWYAPRDVEGAYAGSITAAINSCSVFVLVLNKSSSESPSVLNELELVTRRLSKKEVVSVIPFHIDDEEISDDAKYYISRMHWLDAVTPPLEKRIEELAGRVRSELIACGAKIGNDNRDNKAGKSVLVSGSSVSAVKNFVGRDREIEEIWQQMRQSRSGRVALVGIGGIGKSELAKKYAELHSDEYPVVMWIPFRNSLEETFANDTYVLINGMRRSDYPEDTDRYYFEEKLRRLREVSDSHTLLIIDNFNVTDDPDIDLLCMGEYSIIFTTKNEGVSDNIQDIKVSRIDDTDTLIELFRKVYGLPLSDENIETVKKIIDHYEGHTLSVSLIANAAHDLRSPEEIYEKLLKHETDNSESKKKKDATDTVIDGIRQIFSMTELSDEEKTILCDLSLVPSCGIKVKLLHELAEIDDYSVTDGLVRKSWVIHNAYTDEVFLHPIIAEIALEMALEHQSICEKFFTNLLNMTEMDVVNDDYKKKQLNLKLISSVDDRMSCSWLMKKQIRYRHAKVYYDNAQYKNGAEIFSELLKTETEPALILHCYEKIAQTHVFHGEYEEGCEVSERGWKYAETLPEDKIDALTGRFYVGLLHRLIESYRGIGDYEKSLYYGKLCLASCVDYYNTYRGDSNAWTRYHIGRTLLMKGDYAESEEILRCAADFFESAEDKNGCTSCYALLALICAKKEDKDFDKAISYISEAKKIRLEISGDSSVDYIELLRIEGDIYREMGDMAKCRTLYSDALEMYLENNHRALSKEIEVLLADIDAKS